MTSTTDNEIHSSRELNAPLEKLYEAFANPELLKIWWGPEGFTNTIHSFDLKPGGQWLLTMHGPEKGNYENSSVFKTVLPNQLVSWTRLSPPLFDMSLEFEAITNEKSKIIFKMVFASVEEADKMKKYVVPKNEENFDRLQRLLLLKTQD